MMRRINPEIQKVRDKVPLDGFTPHGVDYVEAASHLLYLLHQVKDMGVCIKDSTRVFATFPICATGGSFTCAGIWARSDQYWHDIETGFAGREPLDETDR